MSIYKMISFFRKIRKNLLNEGKTGRYIKYALGEIILVVIGILIALQINDWNQQNKDQAREKVYLDNIERDLSFQLSLIDLQLEYANKYIANTQPILDHYNKHKTLVLNASLSQMLNTVTERKTFVGVDPTYTDLISSGNIDIIKDLDLKNQLISYYQSLERIVVIIQSNNIHLTDQNYSANILKLVYLDAGYITEPTELLATTNQNLESNVKLLQLINLVSYRLDTANSSIRLMEEIKAQTQELLSLLQQKS